MTLLLDTGLSQNTLDVSNRSTAGNWLGPHVARGLTNNFHGSIYAAPTVSINGRAIDSIGDVFVTDLAFLTNLLGTRIDGLLGVNFLERHVIEVRTDEKIVCVYGAQKTPRGEIVLDVRPTAEGLPTIGKISINGDEHQFIFDTGYNGGLAVDPALFDQLIQKNLVTKVIPRYINKGTKVRSGRLKSAEIWGHTFADVPISESSLNLVGMAVIERFNFTFGLPSKRIALTPSSN